MDEGAFLIAETIDSKGRCRKLIHHVGGHHRQVVHLPRSHGPLHSLAHRRPHPCKQADQKGSQAAGLSPSTFRAIQLFHLKIWLANTFSQCLVPRAQLARIDPAYAYPQATYANYAPAPQGGYYGMQPMPPPVYDPNRPPMYPGGPPPQGGNKIDPEQGGSDYAPPPGPPPPATQRPTNTGSSNNPFADPPRL